MKAEYTGRARTLAEIAAMILAYVVTHLDADTNFVADDIVTAMELLLKSAEQIQRVDDMKLKGSED
jgi:hypothetical protein